MNLIEENPMQFCQLAHALIAYSEIRQVKLSLHQFFAVYLLRAERPQ